MDTFADDAKKYLGISFDDSAVARFSTFLTELVAWNDRVNLTAITDPYDITKKHFIDSLTVISSLPKNASSLIDIGAGAGFPGLPIALTLPSLSVTLLEATSKKVDFLNHMITLLDIVNVTTRKNRAEEAGQDPTLRERFDVAVARAVAYLPILAEYALPLVKVGGVFIAQKTATTDEIKDAEHAIKILGGRVKELKFVTVPGLEERHIVVIEKIGPTPQDYPRRIGVPERKPL
jgi:16S rRNA (guanine527-N7)-methyltransferase